VTTHEDVTDRQRVEAKIAFMARHDLLTGLANRAFFLEKLDEAVARLRRTREGLAVFMLDLDQFKDVNDSLGHPAGDALLRETARRLKASLRETDTLGRLGGDEFAIIQTQIAEPREAAIALAHRIIDAIGESYNIEGNRVNVTTSIGIATAPQDGSDHNELMKKADLALYSAKTKGRNGYRFFDAEMAAGLNTRQQLENELRNALLRHELELHYQLIIDVNTQMPHGAEALLRWRHPQRGLLSADQFIPLAEETGLIIPLGEWVLQKACTDAAAWPAHIKPAVNLSPVQFRKYNLLDVILSALVESGLAPDRLEVEVTEQLLLEDQAEHLAALHQLRNIGVSIVLDNFGTGHSSLSCLTMFSFDRVKIDEFLVHNLTKRAECAPIISSVVALADGLNIMTVAEGVETKQQFEILRASRVNFVQGFLFGRPCPAPELEFCRVHDAVPFHPEQKGATLHAVEVIKKALAS
jgi:diguanylate cyclase (GGDEF)-like protein